MLVIAMLSMLFIVGVTLLNTVTFETQSIAGARTARIQSAVVDNLSREVRSALRAAFLGDDGKPFNRDSESAGSLSPIGDDLYGELPGVHPLVASLEPHDPSNGGPAPTWYFYTATDLELTIANPPTPLNTAVNDGATSPPGGESGINLVIVDAELGTNGSAHPLLPIDATSGNWNELNDGSSFLDITTLTSPSGELELYRRDADGDGVWDSYEYLLSPDRYPPSVRGAMADELRAADFDALTDGDPDALYYALRVIPHGAMVDMGNAHVTLLDAVLNHAFPPLNGNNETDRVTGSYIPEGEEVQLRRRFLLPPPRLPLSNLQAHPLANGQIPETLYRAFVPETNWQEFIDTAGSGIDPRWWPIDTGANGDDLAAISATADPDNPGWLNWVDPFDTSGTGKYDYRHLITTASHDDNLMRMGRDPASPNGDWIDDIVVTGGPAANFAIDDWPVDRGVAQNDPTNMGPLNGRLKVSLPGLVDTIIEDYFEANDPLTINFAQLLALGSGNLYYDRFVHTIQDGFRLMLRNADINANGVPDDTSPAEYAHAAAALTANLIDFADADDVPTQVSERNPDGTATGNDVYGLERQPFITEVYYDPGPPVAYAVELFNPYPADDGGALAMGEYRLVTGVGSFDLPPSNLAPEAWIVFQGDENVPGSDAAIAGFSFAAGDTVQLIRVVNTDEVIVDSMVAPPDSPTPVSMERYTSAALPWLATIPTENQVAVESLGAHSTAAPPPDLRPVEIRFANSGDMRTAFPTTGSLLLLSRYANSTTAPFNESLVNATMNPPAEHRIDNGRMPVFDTLAEGLGAPPDPTDPFALAIPWGQLVFDYFTALPLEHEYDPNAATPEDWIPTVDQGGVRVHGRIDINSAPWSVLAGLPMVPSDAFSAWPVSLSATITNTALLNPNPTLATPIGASLAQSIVAYREARAIADGAGNTEDFGVARLRLGTGFLTVGELANIHIPLGEGGTSSNAAAYNIDSGAINDAALANQDYVRAVAVLVALGDWVTTRSHVFTVYGTLRGAGQKSAVDQKAIRFQETVDRLPSLFTNRLPRRIGPRVVGPYAQASDN